MIHHYKSKMARNNQSTDYYTWNSFASSLFNSQIWIKSDIRHDIYDPFENIMFILNKSH